MSALIVSFTGSRLGMSSHQLAETFRYLITRRPWAAVHGGCVGSDDQFDEMCAELEINRIVMPSVISDKRIPNQVLMARGRRLAILPPRLPLTRNRVIARRGDELIACPSQATEVLRSGTWATVRYAKAAHKKIWLMLPGGSP